MSTRRPLAGLACVLVCMPAHAADGALEGFAWQATLGLALVLATIALATWVLRRVTQVVGASKGPLQTVAVLAVGPKERIVLVECADTWVVVGVAPGRVNALHAIPRPQSPAAAEPAAEMPVAREAGFRRWLEQAIGGHGAR